MKRSHSSGLSRKVTNLIGVVSLGSLVTLVACGQSTNTTQTESAESDSIGQVSPGDTATVPAAAPTTSGVPVDPALNNVLDEQFVLKAAQDNLFEIQAGQLASEQATNNAVKQFAQMMVRDHTQATQQLEQIASARNVTLPTDMGEQNQALFDRLSGLSKEEFDQAYMTEMVNSHRMDVTLFQNQAQQGQDQELKTQAAQKLPALQQHLQAAEELLQQVGG